MTEEMDWVPIVFVAFKLVVFGVGMFYAIKWHHEKAKKERMAAAEARKLKNPDQDQAGSH